MIILIDTDILLDIALKRKPFFEYSSKVIDKCESNAIIGFVAWHTLSNLYYLTASASGKKRAKEFIADLLNFIRVAPVKTENAIKAILLELPDFEYALQTASALACNADFIITGNVKHYKKSPVPALRPEEFFKKLLDEK